MEPSYRRTRREAWWAFLSWFAAGVWVITTCYLLGYGEPVTSVGGVPHWVLWGVFVPWLVFAIHNCWYALFYLHDDEESGDSSESPETDPH